MTETDATAPPAAQRSPLRTVLYIVAGLILFVLMLGGLGVRGMAKDTDLAVGSVAPDFTLPDQTGTSVQLSSVLKTHRGAIVAFYPKDFTPG